MEHGTTTPPSICKACGEAIATPGPRVIVSGMTGEFHTRCEYSATVLAERERCARIAEKSGNYGIAWAIRNQQ